MKQAQNARNSRSRNTQRKSGGKSSAGNNRNDNKVRGNPKQLLEKYKTQAREATQAGDRITAENFLQFADHYQRILNEMRGNQQNNQKRGDNTNRDAEANNNDPRSDRGDKDSRDQKRGRRPRHNNRADAVQASDNTVVEGQAPESPQVESEVNDVPEQVEQAEQVALDLEAPASDIKEETVEEVKTEKAPPKKRKAPVRRKKTPKAEGDEAAPEAEEKPKPRRRKKAETSDSEEAA